MMLMCYVCRWGRKPLLQISFAGMAACLAGVAAVVYVPCKRFRGGGMGRGGGGEGGKRVGRREISHISALGGKRGWLSLLCGRGSATIL